MLRDINMGLRALPLTPPRSNFPSNFGVSQDLCTYRFNKAFKFTVSAKTEKGEKEEPKKNNQSLFSNITEALDFSQVRSAEDAELLAEAREATKSGEKMSREQYGALRRKIGGTYKDFFKSYVEVDGQYVEEGWVDKTCKVCKKDTKGEPRQVDKLGRYVHVECLEKSKSGNFLPDFSQVEDDGWVIKEFIYLFFPVVITIVIAWWKRIAFAFYTLKAVCRQFN